MWVIESLTGAIPFTAQKHSLTRCARYEHPETIQLWVAEELATRPTNSQAI